MTVPREHGTRGPIRSRKQKTPKRSRVSGQHNHKQENANTTHASTRPSIFFHPDYTVGLGISPNHALRLAGYTAGRESHPALKIFCYDDATNYTPQHDRPAGIPPSTKSARTPRRNEQSRRKHPAFQRTDDNHDINDHPATRGKRIRHPQREPPASPHNRHDSNAAPRQDAHTTRTPDPPDPAPPPRHHRHADCVPNRSTPNHAPRSP